MVSLLLATLLAGAALVHGQAVGNATVPLTNPLTTVANSTVGKSFSGSPPLVSPSFSGPHRRSCQRTRGE